MASLPTEKLEIAPNVLFEKSREQLEADVGRLLDELLAAGLVHWQR